MNSGSNFGFLSLLLVAQLNVARAQDSIHPAATRERDSAKECALCHYSWVSAFSSGQGTNLVPYQKERVATASWMCMSCHDGSVVDSRARLQGLRGHKTGEAPPEEMTIPDQFPVRSGTIECATCHTAHAVASAEKTETSIFLRMSNPDSVMCSACHEAMSGGLEEGHHPLGKLGQAVPDALIALGAKGGPDRDLVTCETCHTAHGSPWGNLLVDEVGQLCLYCHENQDRGHPVNMLPEPDQIPEALFAAGASLGAEGQLVCISCHKVHNNKRELLLVAAPKELCQQCHADQTSVVRTKHNLAESAPEAVNVNGETAEVGGSCSACHLAHKPARRGVASKMRATACQGCHGEGQLAPSEALQGYMHPLGPLLPGKDVNCRSCHNPHKEGQSFLQGDQKFLCGSCHEDRLVVADSRHDLRTLPDKELRKLEEPPQLCTSCHMMHLSQSDWWKSSPNREGPPQFRACSSCHREGGIAGWSVPIVAHPLEGLTCADCHDPHQEIADGTVSTVVEGEKPKGRFLRLPVSPPVLCAQCHEDKALVADTAHDLTTTESTATNSMGMKPLESGTCGVCHAMHENTRDPVLWAQKKPRKATGDKMADMCGGCHQKSGAASTIPEISTHPDVVLPETNWSDITSPRFFPLFDNDSGERHKNGGLTCASCHEVHRWDPRTEDRGTNTEGDAMNSFLRTDSGSLPCSDCHGIGSLYLYKFFHRAEGRQGLMGVQYE